MIDLPFTLLRRCLTSGWIFLALLLGSAASHGAGDIAARYAKADEIAMVQINHVGNLVNPTLSTGGMLAVEAMVYVGEVKHAWKGRGRESMKFRVELSDCALSLRAQQVYLIFGRRSADDELLVSHCEDMVDSDAATALAVGLDNLTRLSFAQP